MTVAIIVPFRSPPAVRDEQLSRFVAHMAGFLDGADWRMYVVAQSPDRRKFNRGKLLNAGYIRALEDGCGRFVFHDVDLLPSRGLLPAYLAGPEAPPLHIARAWGRYPGRDYAGGATSWSAAQFEAINGYPNTYWGWGGEDDETMRRCRAVHGRDFEMAGPAPGSGRLVDLEGLSLEGKLRALSADGGSAKCSVRWELRDDHARTWRVDGLNSLGGTYSVIRETPLGARVLRVDVELGLNDHWSDAAASFSSPSSTRSKRRRRN